MEVITNVQKIYDIKKQGEGATGVIEARVTEVGRQFADSVSCTLQDGGKYPERYVPVSLNPRAMTQADVGKTFHFAVTVVSKWSEKHRKDFMNIKAVMQEEVSAASKTGTTYVGEDVKGKVRHGVVCAGIESGQLKCETREHCEAWVDFIMNGIETVPANSTAGLPASGSLLDPTPTVEEESIPF